MNEKSTLMKQAPDVLLKNSHLFPCINVYRVCMLLQNFLILVYYSVVARRLKLDRVLEYMMDNAADREVWDMADQGKNKKLAAKWK